MMIIRVDQILMAYAWAGPICNQISREKTSFNVKLRKFPDVIDEIPNVFELLLICFVFPETWPIEKFAETPDVSEKIPDGEQYR